MKTPIDQIVERRANQLLERAVAGEPVSEEEFAALKRLAGLASLAADARSTQRRTWPVAAVALVTLALVSLLLYSRVPSTEIELDAKLSEVSFTLTSRQAVLATQNLVAVGASGLEHVALPYIRDGAPTVLDAMSGELCNAEIALTGDVARRGVVSLNALAVPGGTKVSLTRQADDRVALLLTPPASQRLSIGVSIRGHVHTVARCPSGTVNGEQNYASPQLIELTGASSTPISLQFTVVPGATLAFSSQMGVSDISMLQVDELIEGTGPLARQVSSLASGSLYLESLNGKEITLRPNEELRFSRSSGEIRKLSLSPNGGSDAGTLALEAHASVKGMTIGRPPNVRSLMPTYLEWLSARRGLALLWGSTLYVSGVLASLLRWLRISR
jgi:hypothetical protein